MSKKWSSARLGSKAPASSFWLASWPEHTMCKVDMDRKEGLGRCAAYWRRAMARSLLSRHLSSQPTFVATSVVGAGLSQPSYPPSAASDRGASTLARDGEDELLVDIGDRGGRNEQFWHPQEHELRCRARAPETTRACPSPSAPQQQPHMPPRAPLRSRGAPEPHGINWLVSLVSNMILLRRYQI